MSYFRFKLLVDYGISLIKQYRGIAALALEFGKRPAATAHQKSSPYNIMNYCSTTQQNSWCFLHLWPGDEGQNSLIQELRLSSLIHNLSISILR